MTSLSYGEKMVIEAACGANIRLDGRQRDDRRHIQITLGEIPSANGSSRVKIENTDVLAAVKAEMKTPVVINGEDCGQLIIDVNVSNMSGQWDFEEAATLSAFYTTEMNRIYNQSETIPRKLLAIEPGKSAWTLYVDVVVYSSSGNLFDAIAIATKSALATCVLPSLTVIKRGAESGSITEYEVEVSEDPQDSSNLLSWDPFLPLACTICRVGEHIIVDPSLDEEACVSAQLLVTYDARHLVLGLTKFGSGAFSPATLKLAVDESTQFCRDLFDQYSQTLMVAVGYKSDDVFEDDVFEDHE